MTDAARWFPVARSEEVMDRQVAQAQLLGREIALWRDATGRVNAWENRCPHRGVRLSIGVNTGTELRCRYHGWRFTTGSGQCAHIPAHPTQKPAAGIRATVYGSAEYAGFVWSVLEPGVEGPSPSPSLPAALPVLAALPPRGTTLRSIHVAASADAVSRALLRGYGMASHGVPVAALDEFILQARHPASASAAALASASISTSAAASTSAPASSSASASASADAAITFLLQPMTAAQTVIHGIVHAQYPAHERLAVWRTHNSRLCALRDALE